MKKVLLLVILATGVCQVKAQIALAPFFNSKITWSPTLKPKTTADLFSKPTTLPQLDFPMNVVEVQPMRYLMPIAKVSGNYRMPVVKTDEPGMHYTMLIAGYEKPKQDSVKTTP